MTATISPRRYKFCITRFEAYEGQNQIHVNPLRTKHQISNSPEPTSMNDPRQTQPLPGSQTALADQARKRLAADLKRIRSSLCPSRIAFLRRRLNRQWRWLNLQGTREESEVTVGMASPTSNLTSDGDQGRNDRGPKEVPPGLKISKRFSEILAGRQQPLPRKKYSPSKRPDEECATHSLPVLGSDVKAIRRRRGGNDKRFVSTRMGLKEVVAAMEQLHIEDPNATKPQTEARRKRATIVRRRKLNMRLKRSSILA